MDQTFLIIHNAGFIFSGILTLIMGIFVFSKGRGKLVNILYFIMNMAYSVYAFAYLLGSNTVDHDQSRFYFMFTMVTLITATVNAHMTWELLGLSIKFRKVIMLFYSVASILIVFFISSPDLFFEPSKPYLYLPNYYEPGQYYWVFILFFALVTTFFLGTLFKKWLSLVGHEKIRITYLLIAYMWAYGTGSIGFLPLYGIDADPLFSAFVGIHVLILAYAILNYKLLELHIVAARAASFSVFTVLVGLLIVAVNWINEYALKNISGFPNWLIPALSGLCVVIAGFIIMRRIREADVLKYEFINNISHKFRTPLTHIRWMSEELRDEPDLKIRNREVEQIQFATMRLFELTNIVMDVAQDSEIESIYSVTPFNLKEMIDNMVDSHNDQVSRKRLQVSIDCPSDLPEIVADKTRLHFAIQILFENSIVYTPEGGKISISVRYDRINQQFIFVVKDSGIGISRDDIPNLFRKFFRGSNARLADTEGMGIGLYMAKKIILRHNGHVTIDSSGENMGTSITFTIPQKT